MSDGSLDLIFDTQVLVWIASDDRRVSPKVSSAIRDLSTRSYVSAVTAWEFADLEERGRFPPAVRFEAICRQLEISLLDFPRETWRRACSLPPIHRDPIDRMLIAHALEAGLTLVTADADMQKYPVPFLW